MPAVVVERAEEGLVNGAADELPHRFVVREHVLERVGLALDPEPVIALNPGGDRVGRRLASVDDRPIVLRRGDWPLSGLEAASEEVVPAREAPMLVARVV